MPRNPILTISSRIWSRSRCALRGLLATWLALALLIPSIPVEPWPRTPAHSPRPSKPPRGQGRRPQAARQTPPLHDGRRLPQGHRPDAAGRRACSSTCLALRRAEVGIHDAGSARVRRGRSQGRDKADPKYEQAGRSLAERDAQSVGIDPKTMQETGWALTALKWLGSAALHYWFLTGPLLLLGRDLGPASETTRLGARSTPLQTSFPNRA